MTIHSYLPSLLLMPMVMLPSTFFDHRLSIQIKAIGPQMNKDMVKNNDDTTVPTIQ